MKRYILLGFVCAATFILTSCGTTHPTFYKTQVRRDLIQENWMARLNQNPNIWTACADRWYFTDEPRTFNDYARNAPYSAAITAMMVRVPDITNIVVMGPYRVQLYGRQMQSSLFIIGPNQAARHVGIDIKGNTLIIHPAADCHRDSACASKDLIIRIGVRELNSLVSSGTGVIEGKDITSNALIVKSTNLNQILLTGNMNLQRVIQRGAGTISVIGAYSPVMDIDDPSNGNVNVSGHIGIRNVYKRGSGTINVIGADSDGLKINSGGNGVVAISGYANLKKLDVFNNSQVYLYWVYTNGIYINIHDGARVGLAGSTKNLDIEVDGSSRFEGKYLRADNIYVRTRNWSHANVYPQQKLFANATDNSSIYFFGAPNVISRYTSGNGIIIPIFSAGCPVPAPRPPANCTVPYKDEVSYKGETSYKGENTYYRKHKRKYHHTYTYQ